MRPRACLYFALCLTSCGGDTSNASMVWRGEAPPTSAWLDGVWASGDHDVYAVGVGGTIIHSNNDGSPWTLQPLGPLQVQGSTVTADYVVLWGIGGSSATDVYAVGDHGVILHSAGNGQWVQQQSPVSVSLNHVWANSAQDVYVVGDSGTILHGDGTGAWTPQPSGTSDRLWSVWASGPNDVFVVGGKSGLTSSESPAESLILHSVDSGKSWDPVTVPAGGRDLGAVWGMLGGSVIAVGWDRILRTADGSSWSEVPADGAIGMDALAGDSQHVYAAGNGIVLASESDGASWHQVLGGFGIQSEWVIPRGDCYVVGSGSDGNGGPNVGAIGHGE